MDYRSQGIRQKVRKVARYLRLYGVRRTWAKVASQRHMGRAYEILPNSSDAVSPKQSIGIIGCGNFGFSTLSYYLHRNFGKVIGAAMDISPHRAASLAETYGAPLHSTNALRLLDHPQIRMIFIASNHASHADYAIEALRRNKHVYIEKPHVVNEVQLLRLCEAMRRSTGKVFLGFNRPGSRFGRIISQHLEREQGPAVINWFVATHDLEPDHWYFNPGEGGRVLGNLCHWTDTLLHLVNTKQFPMQIVPVRQGTADTNLSANFTFADGSVASITFSEMGTTFEGVRERLSVHKGNSLIMMDDFERLTVDVVEKKYRYRNWFRDHGHEANIVNAYRNVFEDRQYDRDAMISYVANTGWLFLKTRDALESNQKIMVDHFGVNVQGARAA